METRDEYGLGRGEGGSVVLLVNNNFYPHKTNVNHEILTTFPASRDT